MAVVLQKKKIKRKDNDEGIISKHDSGTKKKTPVKEKLI